MTAKTKQTKTPIRAAQRAPVAAGGNDEGVRAIAGKGTPKGETIKGYTRADGVKVKPHKRGPRRTTRVANAADALLIRQVHDYCVQHVITHNVLARDSGIHSSTAAKLVTNQAHYLKATTSEKLRAWLEAAKACEPAQEGGPYYPDAQQQLPLEPPSAPHSDANQTEGVPSLGTATSHQQPLSQPQANELTVDASQPLPLTTAEVEQVVQESTNVLHERVSRLERQLEIQAEQLSEAHRTLLQLVRKVLL